MKIVITGAGGLVGGALARRFTPMRCTLSEELGLASMRGWRDALAAYVAADLARKT